MTKKKRGRKSRVGRKPVPLKSRYVWTLDDLMRRCGGESPEECWDDYMTQWGDRPKRSYTQMYPCVIYAGVLKVLVRRLAWFLLHGEDPPPKVKLVMVVCDNPYCQNPHHAKPMWEGQKTARAALKNGGAGLVTRAKVAASKRRNSSKLINGMETAREIRADTRPWKERPWERYGISATLYKRIRANKAWIEYEKLGVFARMAA